MAATHNLSKAGWNIPGFSSDDTKAVDKERDGESPAADMDPESKAGADLSVDETDFPNPEEQAGVRKVEAVTLTWSRRSLSLIYIK
jgi:hypothetical protein